MNYTAADFHRYHSGSMNEAERHALEKAALEDPFLADALDGYVHTQTAEKDINQLKERLLKKDENKKIIAFGSQRKIWWRVAAILVVGLGITYLALQINGSKTQIPLAKNEKDPGAGKTKENSLPQKTTDTVVANESYNVTATAPAGSKSAEVKDESGINEVEELLKPIKESQRRDAAVDETVLKDKTPLKLEKSSPVFDDSNDSNRIAMNDGIPDKKNQYKSYNWEVRTDSNLTYSFNGKVVDNNGNPVAYATIIERNRNKGFATDDSGRFSITGMDSTIPVTFAAVGYDKLDRQLTPNVDQTIVLPENKRALSEVVVTGVGTKKERTGKKSFAKSLEGRAPGLMVTPQPVTGTDNYNYYLRDSIKRPTFANGNVYKGAVTLSFKIKKNGEPYKITVEKSLCKTCDEEAIRLLRTGPKWKYVDNKRVTQVIIF